MLVRVAIQSRIDAAIAEAKVNELSEDFISVQARGSENMELHFQLAIRDQIISEQNARLFMDVGGDVARGIEQGDRTRHSVS